MSWLLFVGLVVVLGLGFAAALSRREELARMEHVVRDRARAVSLGRAEARLQHPVIDLTRCMGCATCVAVCPEGGVLEIVHGQSVVVNGARCMGIAACERECPVGAIDITLSNVAERDDVPALTDELEAVGTPGLFLAGEVTAHTLVKTAIEHGTAVADTVARRIARGTTVSGDGGDALDLVIVGAGPAGLACSLEAKRRGLRFVTLDQEHEIGGTVAKYPRRKLVLMQPVYLPLYGRLGRTEYTKEELIELWQRVVAEQELPIRGGEVFRGLERDADGRFVVQTETGVCTAAFVCLAMGRRGVPRRLGVPGEELPKVAHHLLDARAHRGQRIVVVGGGDSAVETALDLAAQPENQVTLSYRGESFYRLRTRNEERLARGVAEAKLHVLTTSEVRSIRPDAIELVAQDRQGPKSVLLPNDEVFVMAGGEPPFPLLERAGVSFDPALRPLPPPPVERGTDLRRALGFALFFTFLALAWALWHADYYLLPRVERPTHPKHDLLRPGLGVGIGLGFAAVGLILVNLTYLLRRAPGIPLRFGSLRIWMTSHVATGVLALLCALLHGAMAPRDSFGGHALWALAAIVVTGAIGRYFYAWVPRAANGRELALDEVRARLDRLPEDWARFPGGFGKRVRDEVHALIRARQWKGTFLGRLLALVGVQRDLRRTLTRLGNEARKAGASPSQVREVRRLTRDAHRQALTVAHFEDLRAILDTWRYLHRWGSALMVVLVVLHVVYALVYGTLAFDGGGA